MKITRRSIAMLLFVVMLFSCCQGALVSVFAAEVDGAETTDMAVTEPSEVLNTKSETEESSGSDYTRLEAEVNANIQLYSELLLGYEKASGGYVVSKPRIDNAFQLELFDDLGASSLENTPYVKYNVFAEAEGAYELRIGVVVEKLSNYNDFYIPVVVNGTAYKAVCKSLSESDGIYEFSVTVDLIAGKNAVYCTPFDAMSYLVTVEYDANAISESVIGFDYLDIPKGVSGLVKDEVEQVELVIPSISISDPEGNGGISLLSDDTSGEVNSEVSGGGGTSLGSNPNYTGGLLYNISVGVTMQVVYYHYEDVYSAELLYNQILNSVENYDNKNATDNAMDHNGNDLAYTIFDPNCYTKNCFFYDSITRSSNYGSVFKLNYYTFTSTERKFAKVNGSRFSLENHVFPNSNAAYGYKVTDTAVSNFLKQIIMGEDYGAWNPADVASDTSTYAKVLKTLGVSSTHISNYLKAYNGELSLATTSGKNTLIPVIIWKYIVFQENTVNTESGEGENASYMFLPIDVADAFEASERGNQLDGGAEDWWRTAYKWDHAASNHTWNGNSVTKYSSSVFTALSNKFGLGGKCAWDPGCSYVCKAMFGTGHATDGSTNHNNANYSWSSSMSVTDVIGTGFVNAIGAKGYDKQGYGNYSYHFRGFWAPFGVGSGSVTYVKKDANDSTKTLAGAKFQLFKDSACKNPVTASDYTVEPTSANNIGYSSVSVRISNSSGKFSYANLRSGVYFLKETTAPAGYALNSNPTMVSIQNSSKTGTITNVELVKDYQVTIQKTAAGGTSLTTQLVGNDLYSQNLAGAVFDIYVNGVFSERVTTGSNGKATTSKKYAVDTVLTIKEVTAPKGYKISTASKTYTVIDSSSQSVSISNTPLWDPAQLWFTKIDKSTGMPHGNASFEGAIFKFEFYDDAHWQGTPLRTWYFQTDSNGLVRYAKDWLIDTATYPSDDLYVSYNGRVSLPLGYLKVTEVVAPEGYGLLPSLYGSVVEDSSVAEGVSFYWDDREIPVGKDANNKDIYTDSIVYSHDGNYVMEEAEGILAAFSVRKIDKDLWEKNAKQGDITSLRAQFRVINLSTNPVKIGDFAEAGNGEECFTFWTSSSGFYQSEAVFPVGKYRIEEVTPPTGMLLNSTWYKEFEVKSTTTNGYIFNFSSTVEKSCPDDIFRGGFTIYKVDNDRFDSEHANIQNPQGGASFVGTQFVVYNRSTNPVVVNGTTYAVGDICYSFTMTTESGVYTSASNVLPYGTYEIKESVAGPGYDVNEDWSATFSIRKNGVIVEANSRTNNPLEEPIHRGDLLVIKLDQETMHSYGQGDATLAGAIVQVVNNNTYAVYTDRDGNGNYAWYSKGQVCLYITFNENGQASTVGKEAYKEKKALPYGSYTVSEYAPSEGYKINSTWSKTITIGATTTSVNLTPANNHLPEPIIRGGFAIYKVDKNRYELGNSSLQNPQGSATFKGTVFAVYNRSKGPVRVNGKDYAVGSVCYTFTMESASGEFKSAIDLLPYGTYEIKELTAPTGYLVNSSWSATFSIRKDGVIVNANTRTDNPCAEPVIRGGVEVSKIDKETSKSEAQGNATLAGAVFEVVTKNTYGVYTDLDGDGVLEMHGNGTVCLRITTNSKGVAKSASNALPYGTYTIKETSAPEGYRVNSSWSATIVISKNGVVVKTEVPVEEPIIRGGFSLNKVDVNRYQHWVESGKPSDKIEDLSKPQGGATLGKTTFEVKNLSDNAVYVQGKLYASGDICFTFSVSAKGTYTSSNNLLPYGKYEIKEKSPGTGYLLNNTWSKVIDITESGVIVPANSKTSDPVINDPIRGGVKLFKIDNDTSKSTGQGEATIAGAVIAIVNNNTYAVYTDKWGTGEYKWYGNGSVCLVLTVNSNGQATSTSTALPYGNYKAHEQEAPEGYLLNEDWEISFSITTNDYIKTLTSVDLILKDPVIRGGVKVEKFDELLGVNTAAGCNLSGISFSVYSNNAQPVKIGGVTYNKGAKVATMHLGWNESEGKWMSQLGESTLPYGTYTIKENKKSANSAYANDSYLWSNTQYTFSIRNDGEIVEVDTSNNPIVYQNLPVGRIDLLKVNQRNVSLAGVKMCLEWSEDGSEWTPVQSIAAETFTPGGSTTQGIVDGCLVTNQTGELSYTGLDPRLQYRLTEVETLNGYSLLNGPVFTGTLKANENSQWTQKYKVVNADIFKLPEVGSYDMAIVPFILAICVTVSTVALVYFRKRRGIANT